jgi:putative hemolysin
MTNARLARPPFSLGCGRLLDALVGLSPVQRAYAALPGGDFVTEALDQLDVRPEVRYSERLPEGPTIVIANHPTGALDGLVLLSVLRQFHPDVRVLGNRWLTRIPEMRDWTIPVDLYATHAAQKAPALRRATRWLTGGGALIVFPAGAVARRVEDGGSAVDEPWHPGVLALARWTRATIVPVHLDSSPSRWLQWAGRVHSAAATAMLARELMRQRGARVPVTIGQPVDATRLEAFPDPSAKLAYLRARVSALRPARPTVAHAAPLAPELLHSLVAREIAALPASACLIESGPYRVYCAGADAIPLALREIGRLREQAFRQVGEGTGALRDLDAFDRHYQHLFVWHRLRAEIVGAYRLGEAHADSGPLYTETLFRWRERPHVALGEALELGRSFVRPEYQRDPAALLLLWRGIGAYVATRPHLRRLFGPVSVSAGYSRQSRDAIARWLLGHVPGAARVGPQHQVPTCAEVDTLLRTGSLSTVADLDQFVRDLEGGQGLPVLLRQYLRLNGQVLAVSRDPHFADAMDVLLVVDLLEMPKSHLERYCGREGARAIHRYWGTPAGRPPSDTRQAEAAASSVC